MTYKYNGIEISTDDMSRKFLHSYVREKNFGIVYIRLLTDSFVEIALGRETKQIPSEKFEIVQEYPDVGVMINYKKTCGLISRIPRRQWVAGLIQGTLNVVNPAGYPTFTPSGLTFSLARSLFDPEYPSMDTVFGAINEDPSLALAFSPVYWMCNPSGAEIKLYRRSIELGAMSKDKETYTLHLLDHSCSMEQELKDEIKNVKFTIKQSI